MLAEFYQREAHIASRTILLSTVGSIVTLSVLLMVMGIEAEGHTVCGLRIDPRHAADQRAPIRFITPDKTAAGVG